jgi:hypothetical protein
MAAAAAAAAVTAALISGVHQLHHLGGNVVPQERHGGQQININHLMCV